MLIIEVAACVEQDCMITKPFLIFQPTGGKQSGPSITVQLPSENLRYESQSASVQCLLRLSLFGVADELKPHPAAWVDRPWIGWQHVAGHK